MEYHLTMERTQRFEITFDAPDDATAAHQAGLMFQNAKSHPEQFEGGDVEHDCALTDSTYRDIIPWG